MPSFTDLKSLQQYLKKQVKESLKDVGNTVETETKKNMDKVVYDAYDPQDYHRTYELRESTSSHVLEDVDGTLILETFNDVSKINSYITPSDEWNIHADINGNDRSNQIPEWTVKGHGGLFHMPARDYIEATENELNRNKKHVKTLKNSLKKKGINAQG